MPTLRLIVCLTASLAIAAAQTPCGGHGDKSSLLVSANWLTDHLKDANVTSLFVGQRTDYNSAHIPGSLFLAYTDLQAARDAEHPLNLEMPPAAQMQELLVKLGIGNTSRIVLYTAKGIAPQATRAYLTLDTLGLGAQTSILDGGFSQWQAEGRPSTDEVRPVKPGQLQLCPQTDTIVDASYISGNLHKAGVAIVDARDPQYYTGASPSPAGKRAGHIPGAGNLPYSTLVDANGKLSPAEKLRGQFSAAGFHTGDRVVVYCHIGQQASMAYFAARYLGLDVRLYDGSWEDWSARTELPAEVAAGIAPAKQ